MHLHILNLVFKRVNSICRIKFATYKPLDKKTVENSSASWKFSVLCFLKFVSFVLDRVWARTPNFKRNKDIYYSKGQQSEISISVNLLAYIRL